MKRSISQLIDKISEARRVGAITQVRASADTFTSVLTLEKTVAHKLQFEVATLMSTPVMEKLKSYISDNFKNVLYVNVTHTTITITYTQDHA